MGVVPPPAKKVDFFYTNCKKYSACPESFFLLKPFFSNAIFWVTLFKIAHFRAFRFDWYMYKKKQKKVYFLVVKEKYLVKISIFQEIIIFSLQKLTFSWPPPPLTNMSAKNVFFWTFPLRDSQIKPETRIYSQLSSLGLRVGCWRYQTTEFRVRF